MSTERIDLNLGDHLARGLLRFFRSGGQAHLSESGFSRREDVEFLRIHWAFSPQIEDLADQLLIRRHELQTALESRLIDDQYVVRGRLAPARTAIRRLTSGDPARISYFEPVRSYKTGSNHVLIWVVQQAHTVLQRYFDLLSGSDQYSERVERVLSKLYAIRQRTFIGRAADDTSMKTRPSSSSLTQASRSRKRIYPLAFEAYRLLTRIEDREDDAILDVLNKTLIGPLEDWRQFELLVALRITEALSVAEGRPAVLYPITPGTSKPIASVGKFDVYWQSRTKYAKTPELEPSEALVNEILAGYGLRPGGDQPDVVVCDREIGQVIAIVEAKYYGSGDLAWRDALRAAVTQIVRYARLYDATLPNPILGHSLAALKLVPSEIKAKVIDLRHPLAVGLDDLIAGNLQFWADRLFAPRLL